MSELLHSIELRETIAQVITSLHWVMKSLHGVMTSPPFPSADDKTALSSGDDITAIAIIR